jgi:hypothetical protein
MSISAASAVPAQAAVDTSSCVTPLLSQPFTASGDTNLYTLAPGQDASGFTGAGWTLSGGATVTAGTLPGGAVGTVVDLPSGATAVSPAMCVTSDYPTARAMLQPVVGSGGVSFAVSYAGAATWEKPRTTGLFHTAGSGWAATGSVQMQPANVSGWQLVRVVLTGAPHSESRLADLFVDPRMGH